VTGVFCTSGSEREFTLEERWYADDVRDTHISGNGHWEHLRAVGGRGQLKFSFRVARWVNICNYVNMAISKIRKYLDDLKIRNSGPVAPDIDLKKVPEPPEPAPKTPEEDVVPFTE